jgi:hypothetical protein
MDCGEIAELDEMCEAKARLSKANFTFGNPCVKKVCARYSKAKSSERLPYEVEGYELLSRLECTKI